MVRHQVSAFPCFTTLATPLTDQIGSGAEHRPADRIAREIEVRG